MEAVRRLPYIARRGSEIAAHSIWRIFFFSTASRGNKDDEWNDAWEAAWLPDDMNGKTSEPWEADVTFPSTSAVTDPETKSFVEEMNNNWEERKKGASGAIGLYSLNRMKNDYRPRKQRIHAAMWAREVERIEEQTDYPNLGESDIDRLLQSASDIFEEGDESEGDSEVKVKPEGWESSSRADEGGAWDTTRREEDVLVQEFDRRIAYSKFQIASFIKSHIFSRRRPIDGWKYMVEVVGPNSRKGKGSVARIPSLPDSSSHPLVQEGNPNQSNKRSSR